MGKTVTHTCGWGRTPHEIRTVQNSDAQGMVFTRTLSKEVPYGECKGCESETARFLAESDIPADHSIRYDSSNLSKGTRDIAELDELGILPPVTDLPSLPHGPYRTATDAGRTAIRMVRKDAAVKSVLAQIARNGGAIPRMDRADMRAAKRAIRAAYELATLELAEVCEPSKKVAAHWYESLPMDARTYAGPVVQTDANGRVRVYRDNYRQTSVTNDDGTETRTMTRTREYLPISADTAMSLRVRTGHNPCKGKKSKCEGKSERMPDAKGLCKVCGKAWPTVSVPAAWGNRWRRDASSFDADRWAMAQEPRAAVRKPSSRKRRKDGTVGTTMMAVQRGRGI